MKDPIIITDAGDEQPNSSIYQIIQYIYSMKLEQYFQRVEKNQTLNRLESIEFVNLVNSTTGKKIKRYCINGVLEARLALRDYYGKV